MNPRNTNPIFKFEETYILLANLNAQQIIPSPPPVINAFDFHHYLPVVQHVTNHGFAIPSSPSNFCCYGMNTLSLNQGFGVGVSSKRNAQYMYAAAAAATPSLIMNPVLLDVGFTVMASGFPMLVYRGNHIGQSFVSPGPEYRGNNVTRHPQEIGIGGRQRYNNDGASTSQNFQGILHHPSHGFRPQNIHGVGRSNVSHLHSSTTTLSRNLNNNNNNNNATIQQYLNVSHGRQAPGHHSRIRVFRSSRAQRTSQSHSSWHPSIRLLPEEGLAVLEFSGDYEISNHSTDHHSDMRLDIDYMSYEELLALSEQIGNVKTGVSEEAITTHLKTRRAHKQQQQQQQQLEEKNDSACVICQDVYEDEDKIGSLDCGHEFHVHCLRKWLTLKNMCPICKSTALPLHHKN